MANDYYIVQRAPEPHQRLRSEVVKSEMQSIEKGFDGLPSKNLLAGSAHLNAKETAASAADVYVLASVYPFTELLLGTTVRCFFTNTNTGACTADVDGTGVQELNDIDGTTLSGGEVIAGWLHEIVWNGSHWRLQNSARQVTAGIALSSALAPQNYQKDVAIADLVMPAATGGTAPYTYKLTGLPAGLVYATLGRIVSGTPTTIGTSSVTYTVTDSNANVFQFQFQIRIVAALLMLPDPQDRTLTVGSSYTFTPSPATGGTVPYIYSVEHLPAGLVFDAETREISGSPSSSEIGETTVILHVSDSGVTAQTASASFDLTVRSAAELSLAGIGDFIFPPDAPIPTITIPAAHGGVPPYSYIVTGLGEGLTFDEVTREISGTPTTVGVRTIHARVEGDDGSDVERQFEINISPRGARYILVSFDRDVTATDIVGGNSYAVSDQSLTLPSWVGSRFIVIAQPANQPDLTSISLAGLGNSRSDFEKQSYTRTIDGLKYEIWVGFDVQGDAISGEIIEVRP